MELKALLLAVVALLYGAVAAIELMNGRSAWSLVFGFYAAAGVAMMVANRSSI